MLLAVQAIINIIYTMLFVLFFQVETSLWHLWVET